MLKFHALEGGQRHLLHLQRLDRGTQGAGVLLQPEVHGLEFFNALFQLIDIQGGRDPVAQVGHLWNVVAGAFGQALQKVKSRYKFAKTGGVCVTHMHSMGGCQL
jgi:hypothetical protein